MTMRLTYLLALGLLGNALAAAAESFHLNIKDCESSALLSGHCPSGSGACLWMGDNENKKALYRVEKLDPSAPTAKDVPMTKVTPTGTEELKVDDIEALAAWSPGHLLVVGSHGHKSDCTAPEERRRFAVFDVENGNSQLLQWKEPWSCANALVAIQGDSPTRFCAEVDANALRALTDLRDPNLTEEQRKLRCPTYPTLNFEGAAADPAGAVWIGARAPLLARSAADTGNQDAVLLRLRAGTSSPLGFDALRRLNLGKQGIRELSASPNWLWIVAGPPLDSSAPFALYRLAWAELDGGKELLEPTFIRTLPNSAEGFALLGKQAWLALDGDKNDKEKCPKHEHLQSMVWPYADDDAAQP